MKKQNDLETMKSMLKKAKVKFEVVSHANGNDTICLNPKTHYGVEMDFDKKGNLNNVETFE
jgi:hypothetical protein